MKLSTFILTFGLGALSLQASAVLPLEMSNQTIRRNPLLEPSKLAFGAPDFKQIKESDYLPAIQEAISRQREEIQQIVDNPDAPTFQNTILAFEQSGQLYERVTRIFDALVDAHKTPVIAETEAKVTPLRTELANEINFNKALFQRIKTVYDREFSKLSGEDQLRKQEDGSRRCLCRQRACPHRASCGRSSSGACT